MDYFAYKNRTLHAEDIAIPELAEELGTPFYCYSHATLARHYRVFEESFGALNRTICFATKSNSHPAVLKALAELGSGADVVSGGEVKSAIEAGFDPGKIVFSGVGKMRDEMAYALEQNIWQFNVESEPELHALSEVARSKGMAARIALRVNPDVIAETHAKISTGHKTTKFGISIPKAMELYKIAATLPGIEVQGISVHIGSQLTSLLPFEKAFTRVREVVEQLRADGVPISVVDLGGGLGIPYESDKGTPPTPADYGAMVERVMGGLDAQFVFEPGRLIVGNAGILVTRVIYVKESEDKTFVILDAGMNDLIRPAMYEAYHEIVPAVQNDDASNATVDIVGPVCETGDIFAADREIPLPKDGDLMVIRSCGAYGAVMANSYNARPIIKEVMVQGRKVISS